MVPAHSSRTQRWRRLGYTHIFTPTLSSDLRLGFQRTNLGYLPPYGRRADFEANLGIPNANTSSMLGGGALIGGYNSQLEYTGDYGTLPGARRTPTKAPGA